MNLKDRRSGIPLKVGSVPVGVTLASGGTEAYVANYGSETVTAVTVRIPHGASGSSVPSLLAGESLKLAGAPVGLSSGGHRVVAALRDSNTLAVAETARRTLKEVSSIQVASPSALYLSKSARYAYVASYATGHLVEVDLVTSQVMASIPAGGEPSSVVVAPVSLGCKVHGDASRLCNNGPPGDPPLPYTTYYTYNPGGELSSVTTPPTPASPNGATTSYTYNLMGNVVSVVDPSGNETTTTYNAADQVTSVTDGAGSTVAATTAYLYNENGYEKQITNPDGETTSYAYGDPAYPSLVTTMTDPLGRTTTYTYNPDGQLSGVTEPTGESISYAYNQVGELCWKAAVLVSSPSCSSPPAATSTDGLATYTYSPDGQLISMTDTTGTTSYLYDSLGRLTSTTDGAGNTVSYAYDPAGNITCIAYPVIQGSSCSSAPSSTNTVVDYSYYPTNQMASMTDWLGNTTSYTYDAAGNLTGVTWPSSTDVSSYLSYDNANNYESTLALNGSFGSGVNWSVGDAWDSNASSLYSSNSVTLGGPDLSGVSSPPAASFTYNQANQMTSGPAVSSYGYSPASEITSVTPSGASAPSAYYSYDAAGELCSSSALTPTASTAPSCGGSSSPVYESGATSTYAYSQDGERTCATPGNFWQLHRVFDALEAILAESAFLGSAGNIRSCCQICKGPVT